MRQRPEPGDVTYAAVYGAMIAAQVTEVAHWYCLRGDDRRRAMHRYREAAQRVADADLKLRLADHAKALEELGDDAQDPP